MSAYLAVPRRGCSGEASVSRIVTSWSPSGSASISVRTVACIPHRQPCPASSGCGCAITSSVTPSGPASECEERTSSIDLVSSIPSPVRRSRSRGSVGTELNFSAGTPSVSARFGFESPSMASTRKPRRASCLAIVPEMEVFPDPPLPATASFIASEGTCADAICVVHIVWSPVRIPLGRPSGRPALRRGGRPCSEGRGSGRDLLPADRRQDSVPPCGHERHRPSVEDHEDPDREHQRREYVERREGVVRVLEVALLALEHGDHVGGEVVAH